MESLLTTINQSYGLKVSSISTLEGYANENFLVEAENGSKYILKLHDMDIGSSDFYMAESEVLDVLSKKVPGAFPQPVRTKGGEPIAVISYDNKNMFSRLLLWLDGTFLKDIEATPDLIGSFGSFVAKMDRLLMDIRHPGIEARRIDWDLSYLPNLKKYANMIPDPGRRKLVEYYLQQISQEVFPYWDSLRKSVIHNDTNDWNVLVKKDQVSGMIDFGDMVYAPLIQEVAIALAYALFDKNEPLEWAGYFLNSYSAELQIEEKEADVLYWLIAGRLCMSLILAAKSIRENPENEYLLVSQNQAWELLQQWIKINPGLAKKKFREAACLKWSEPEPLETRILRRDKHISKAQSVSYKKPIVMSSAAFQYMYDAFGNTFLDAYNNIPHVGHQHPAVVEAGQRQMARLNTNTRYLYDLLASYAERLLNKFPEPLNKVFLVNSGSAASDLAVRMAMTHTRHQGLVVLEHGYHGNTRQAIEISHYKFGRKGGKGPGTNILMAPIPDTYRGPFRQNDGNAGRLYAKNVLELLENSSLEPAAFIAEPVVGCAGQVPLAKEYLKNVYPVIRERGGLCISDEVQTGFGRMGSSFWGFELHDVVPDMVILGKPMGNGHPLAAVVTTDEVADSFDNGMEFFSSFGGNPVSCAIGLAVLDVIEKEALQQNALETGTYFLNLLEELKAEHSNIGDVRGEGLFMGMELVKDPSTQEHHSKLATALKNEMRECYILISTDGPQDNIIKMKPPLCFNRENALQVVETMDDILKNQHF